jgi:hypothetical protein
MELVWVFLLCNRSQWPRCRRHGSAAARTLGLWGSNSAWVWLSVLCDCCVLLDRGHCVGLIAHQGSPAECDLCK